MCGTCVGRKCIKFSANVLGNEMFMAICAYICSAGVLMGTLITLPITPGNRRKSERYTATCLGSVE